MSKRLKERHGLLPSVNYEISEYPTTMQDLHKMIQQGKYHNVSNWAVTRIGFKPTKNISDGGKDGIAHFQVWTTKEGGKDVRVFSEVKTGNVSIGQVRSFHSTMVTEKAQAGIFIMLNKPTSGMKDFANSLGTFEHNNRTYPKLQFWTIDQDYFDNPEILKQIIKLPHEWNLDVIPKSERHVEDTQLDLFEETEIKDMSDPQLESKIEDLQEQIESQRRKSEGVNDIDG